MAKIVTLVVISSILVVNSFAEQPPVRYLNAFTYYKFDEGSGTVAKDTMGNGAGALTLTNGPIFVNSRHGYAVSLDGSNDYLVTPATQNKLINSAQFTLVFHLNFPTQPANSARLFRHDPSGLTAYECYLTQSGTGVTYTYVMNGAGGGGVAGNIVLQPKKDYVLTFVWNNGTMTCFVNGVFDGSNQGLGINMPVSGVTMVIGASTIVPNNPCAMTMDFFFYIERAITPSEAKMLYQKYVASDNSAKVN